MNAGTVSPIQLNLAAAVSDTVTVTVTLNCLGHSHLLLQSDCGCVHDLKARLP